MICWLLLIYPGTMKFKINAKKIRPKNIFAAILYQQRGLVMKQYRSILTVTQ